MFKRSARHWITSILLAALALRALTPAGFMPSAEHPFALQICPEGFPAQLLKNGPLQSLAHAAHEHHEHHAQQVGQDAPAPGDGSHHHPSSQAEHCVFGTAALAGPASQPPVFALLATESQAPPAAQASVVLETQRHRIQQPRAPPTLS